MRQITRIFIMRQKKCCLSNNNNMKLNFKNKFMIKYMRIKIGLLLYASIIYLMLYLYACSCGCPDTENVKPKSTNEVSGEYNFILTDSSGINILEGNMKILSDKKDFISGNYTFKKIYKTDFSGISSMKGFLTGIIENGKGFINTNPKLTDNNVFLKFDIFKDKLEGIWYHSTFKGESGRGKFTAVKKL